MTHYYIRIDVCVTAVFRTWPNNDGERNPGQMWQGGPGHDPDKTVPD